MSDDTERRETGLEGGYVCFRSASHLSRRLRPPAHVCSVTGLPLKRATNWGTARISQPGTASAAATINEIPLYPNISSISAATTRDIISPHQTLLIR